MAETQPRHRLEAEHRPHRIRRRLADERGGGYMADAVLGAIDGAVTSFAVIAGARGGAFSGVVVVILGFANLLADGFSMAVSNFLGTRSRQQAVEKAQREEQRHIDLIPEGQREELRQVFAAKGFEGETLERIVGTISSNRGLWADTVVKEVFGLQAIGDERPLRAGLATFAAFLAAGFVPLMPFLVPALTLDEAFLTSTAATLAAFLAIGLMKGRALQQPLLRASLETLLIGGGAALLAYGVGVLLRVLLGSGALA